MPAPPPPPGIDDAQFREAFRRFLAENEPDVRRWVASLFGASFGPDDAGLLRQLVRDEVASYPLASRAVSPTRMFALFPEAAPGSPLPPARVHAAGAGRVQAPQGAGGQPLEAFLERDPYPLPPTDEREGYHGDRHLDYWLSGLEDFLRVRAALERQGRKLAAPFACLELGCATGRVLRHFLCQAPGLEVWGADINASHVAWLQRHLPRELRPFQCSALPVLPLEDRSLDLVMGFSVFTHIDEFEVAWLLELRRTLRPGGLAYLTVHGEDTWARMRPGLAVYDTLIQNRDSIPEYRIRPELFARRMPLDKTVFRWRSVELYNTNVFFSRRHLNEVWGRFFEVCEIVPQGSGYQEVVVLRRPA